jgi:hypothetical protein
MSQNQIDAITVTSTAPPAEEQMSLFAELKPGVSVDFDRAEAAILGLLRAA